MHIARITPGDVARFRDLVNAEIRPDRAKTNAWDDFPLILDEANRRWMLVARTDDGVLAAGLACLIRNYTTNCRDVAIAGVGSVVTRPDFRGRGLSSALQVAMLAELRRKNVPLAVLWTDQPEIYAGRGFAPAGWEVHVDLAEASLPDAPPPGYRWRDYVPTDAEAVSALYRDHRYRTRREEGDAPRLYGMPGTRGLVMVGDDAEVAAAVFCGKGADFPGYVTEWDGSVERVLPLLAEVRRQGLARHVLCPVGAEDLVDELAGRGADWIAHPSGLWAVVDPGALAEACPGAPQLPTRDAPAAAWLGNVSGDGVIRRGVMDVAIWGFDSV